MAKIENLVKKYKEDLLSVAVLSTTSVSNFISHLTPEDSGSLRASWTPALNKPEYRNVQIKTASERTSSSFVGATNFKQYNVGGNLSKIKGTDTFRHDIDAVTNTLSIGDTYYYTNGQPYAHRVEYDGHSKYKAPQGMFRRGAAKWDDIVAEKVKEVKSGK
jgi:hypothetical protein